MRARPFGQNLDRLGASHELIADTQDRSRIQRLGDPETAKEQDHLHGRWRLVG
jgi:hypothetical protein